MPRMAANSRRAERYLQQKRRARLRLIMGASAVALVGVIVLIVSLGGGSDSSTPKAFAGSVVKLELSEYAIKGNLQVPTGPIRIEATNIGGVQHNIGVRGIKISRNLERGESTTLDLGVLAPGTYDLYCDVTDAVDKKSHVSKGMVAKLVVTAATSTGATSTAATSTAATSTGATSTAATSTGATSTSVP